MGGKTSKQALKAARERAEARSTTLQVTGRYHHLPRRIDDDYRVTDTVLGTGFAGSVLLATSRRASKSSIARRFAVKSIKLNGISQELRRALEAEVEVFLSVDHPHVCRLFDVYESEDRIDLVMECLEGGELYDRIIRHSFAEKDAADAAYQMLLAINYLHSLGIVHRDIKLDNFLYDETDSNYIKIIDFGFSNIWDPEKKMKLACGTLCYAAPEVILKKYTNMCDLWSLGVTVFLLLVGYMPFPLGADPDETELKILNGAFVYHESKWSRVSKTAFDFVTKLLERDPTKRMTAEQALAHPWIVEREQLSGAASFVDQSVVDSLREYANASKFRRCCMQVMAWALTNEERSEVRQAFMELDREKKGTIKLHELKHVLEDRFEINDEGTRRIFEALDSANNEEIRYSEFLAAMLSSRIQVHEDLVMAAFHKFDKDGAGFISVNNLRELLGESLDKEEAESLLRDANLASDGTVSHDEFFRYLTGDEAQESHQVAAEKVIETQLASMDPQELMMRTSFGSMTPMPVSPKSSSRRQPMCFPSEEASKPAEKVETPQLVGSSSQTSARSSMCCMM